MEHDVTFREARMVDYHDVMAIAEVYSGADYLPSQYGMILSSESQTGYVGLVNGEIIAFVASFVVDKGATLVTRAGRVKDTYQGQGIYGLLVKFVRKQFAALDGVEHEAFTTHASNVDKNKDKITAAFTEILTKDVLYYRSGFLFKDMKDSPHALVKMPIRIQKRDLDIIFSSEATCRHLFPDNRMVCCWIPFRLLSSNIDYIMSEDTLVLASCRPRGSNDGDVVYTCLTVGMHYPCKIGMIYVIDIFGSDVSEARDHIQLHADNLQRNITGLECELMVIYEDRLLQADVESIISSVNVLKATRSVVGKLYLFEKSFK